MINITNNTNDSIFLFLKRNEDLYQIGFIEEKKSILKDLNRGEMIEFKLSSQIGDVIYPTKTFQIKTIGNDSFINIGSIIS